MKSKPGHISKKEFSPIPRSMGRDPDKGSISPGRFSPPAKATKNKPVGNAR